MCELTRASIAVLTVAQVKSHLVECRGGDDRLWSLLEQDHRAGVRRLAVRARLLHRRHEAEAARMVRLSEIERRLWSQGVRHIAGVDEVGRGCLAGPVVAAAVVLAPDTDIPGLDDSKVLTPDRRARIRKVIVDRALAVSLGAVPAPEIDRINILQASHKAMREALEGLAIAPERVLVDGNRVPGSRLRESAIIGGDARSISIAAASVVAKVHRDELLVGLEEEYPGYGFARHKGYGSAEHLEALQALGPSPIHRRTFRPVAQATNEQSDLRADSAPRPRKDTVGDLGELAAAAHLESEGYRILARQYRGAGGEIDLIARKADCVAFVEVKTSRHRSTPHPEQRVRRDKQQHLIRAARHFLIRSGLRPECRFDVVAVVLGSGDPEITHFEDAFRPPPP